MGESDDRVRGFAIGLRSHSILFKVHVLFGEQFTRVLTFIGGGGGGGGGGHVMIRRPTEDLEKRDYPDYGHWTMSEDIPPANPQNKVYNLN